MTKDFGLIIKLILSIILIMFFGDYVPEFVQRAFFTFSIFAKETLVFFMPLIVFSFIFACLSSFQQRAPLLIIMILTFVVISNFVFVQLGYGAGDLFLPLLGYHADNAVEKVTALDPLEPFFVFPYPRLISTDIALLLGMLAGLYGAFWGNPTLTRWGNVLRNGIQAALTKIFIPLVPFYVIGFLFKLQHEESLIDTFTGYGPMIGLVIVVQCLSTLFFFASASMGSLQNFKTYLKNFSPAGLVALSTMSSVATLPLTLEAAEKSTKHETLPQVIIPATTNIHHVGDSVGVPILIAAVLAINGLDAMSYGTFLVFSMYYMVAKFGVASVPGGEVLVLAPILADHFGFNAQMIGLLTTLYILIDPFITVTNVLCNGALAIFMDKVCGRMKAFQGVGEALKD